MAGIAAPGLTAADRAELEALIGKKVGSGRKYDCELCEDTGVVPSIVTVNDERFSGVRAIHEYLAKNPTIPKHDLVMSEEGARCEECRVRLMDRKSLEHAKKRNGRQVTIEFVQEAVNQQAGRVTWKSDPMHLAKQTPTESTYLVGGTGTVKTVILELWYNRHLRERRGKTEKLLWMTERRALKQCRVDADQLLDELIKKEVVCFDELFYPPEWKNQDEKGFLNTVGFSGWRDVWEFLSANRQIVVLATSNRRPHEAISEEGTPLLRRMDEVFGDGRRITEL